MINQLYYRRVTAESGAVAASAHEPQSTDTNTQAAGTKELLTGATGHNNGTSTL